MAQTGTSGSLALAESRVEKGVWSALVGPTAEAPRAPEIAALHDGTPLPGLTLSAASGAPGYWRVQVPLPAALIGDRVAVVVLRVGTGAGARDLGRVSIAAGQALLDDLAAEMELLKSVVRQVGRTARAQPVPSIAAPAPPSAALEPAVVPLGEPLVKARPEPAALTDAMADPPPEPSPDPERPRQPRHRGRRPASPDR